MKLLLDFFWLYDEVKIRYSHTDGFHGAIWSLEPDSHRGRLKQLESRTETPKTLVSTHTKQALLAQSREKRLARSKGIACTSVITDAALHYNRYPQVETLLQSPDAESILEAPEESRLSR